MKTENELYAYLQELKNDLEENKKQRKLCSKDDPDYDYWTGEIANTRGQIQAIEYALS